MKKHVLVFVLLLALACGQANVSPAKVEQAPAAAPQEFHVGDTIEAGSLTMTVNSVSEPAGSDFSKPQDGKKFVVVDVTFVNKGTAATSVSSLLQMSLKDSTGQVYKVDPMAIVASGGATPEGELAAGETLRGQVGFQVPSGAAGLVFVFDASLFGTGKVFVAL